MSRAADGRLADGLGRLAFEVTARLSRLAAQEDLSLSQLRMLGILRDHRPRMAQLADALGVDRSSVTGLIARAEQRGLVTRSAAASDGRGVHVELTAAGRALAQRLTDRFGELLGPLLEPLTVQERVALGVALERMLPDPPP